MCKKHQSTFEEITFERLDALKRSEPKFVIRHIESRGFNSRFPREGLQFKILSHLLQISGTSQTPETKYLENSKKSFNNPRRS